MIISLAIITVIIAIVLAIIILRKQKNLIKPDVYQNKLIFTRTETIIVVALVVFMYVGAFSFFCLLSLMSGDDLWKSVGTGLKVCGLCTLLYSFFFIQLILQFSENHRRKKLEVIIRAEEKTEQ